MCLSSSDPRPGSVVLLLMNRWRSIHLRTRKHTPPPPTTWTSPTIPYPMPVFTFLHNILPSTSTVLRNYSKRKKIDFENLWYRYPLSSYKFYTVFIKYLYTTLERKLLNRFLPNLQQIYQLGQDARRPSKNARGGFLEHFEDLSILVLVKNSLETLLKTL